MAETLKKVAGNRIEFSTVETKTSTRTLDDLLADAAIYLNEIEVYQAKLDAVNAIIDQAKELGLTSNKAEAAAKAAQADEIQ